jgi:glycerol-3-phosphate acyltransferase PlsY
VTLHLLDQALARTSLVDPAAIAAPIRAATDQGGLVHAGPLHTLPLHTLQVHAGLIDAGLLRPGLFDTSALDPTFASLLGEPAVWALIVCAYLLGAVPFGLILARWLKGIDLRTFGSGNIGTTNAVRALGRRWGFVVFALDFLKGFAPVLVTPYLVTAAKSDVEFVQVLVGTAGVLGHCYSPYLRFKGGKGVATGCGAIIAIDWRVFVAGAIVWLLTRLLSGYAGLASILMGIAFPVAAWYVGWPARRALVVGAVLLMLLIIVRHRGNIQRMLSGTEPNARHKKQTAGRHG